MNCADPWGVQKERRAACHLRGSRVLPLVADNKRMVEIKMPFESRFDQQSGFRFAAWATIGLVVRANQHVIQGETFAQGVVHSIQLAAGLIAARNSRLIRRGDENKSSGLELL